MAVIRLLTSAALFLSLLTLCDGLAAETMSETDIRAPPEDCKRYSLDDGTMVGFCSQETAPQGEGPVEIVDMAAMATKIAGITALAPEMFEEDNVQTAGPVSYLDRYGTKTTPETCVQTYSPSSHSLHNCNLSHWWYRPYWVYHISKWYRVPWPQWHYWGWCHSYYCVGQSNAPCNYWWKGRCVLNWTYRRVYLYNSSNSIIWRWIRIPNGCCCEPWSYWSLFAKRK